MKIKKTIITLLILKLISFYLYAAPVIPTPSAQTKGTELPTLTAAPNRKIQLFFNNMEQQKSNFTLTNFSTGKYIEFGVRKDELVTQAVLHLQFTPSPALIPLLSQLKIYINDQIINVQSINEQQLGKLNSVDVPIDPRFINDFNRIRLEFIGHYKAVCENPSNSSVWLEVDKNSYLDLTLQTLLLENNLTYFPEPFFDRLDQNPLSLPMVFADQPDLQQQRAAAILASWFGSKALWRGASFPVLFNNLPTSNAVVFATNGQRPDFLKNHKTVNAPTIEMISHPDNPYIKLLLILGRDDHDLLMAVRGVAQGNILFRGPSVIVDNVRMLKPRTPYDAPNWIPTDRPVTFAQLEEFGEQLQTKGYDPHPIRLNFRLPPDLFLNQNRGIDLRLTYRYSEPPEHSISQLNISLNNYFIESFKLEPRKTDKSLPTTQQLFINATELGLNNQLTFLFQYGTQIGGDPCTTYNIVDNFAVIDGTSTINFSDYSHHITMPNLNVFATSGFPFSILADLSQTVVYVNQSQPEAVSTLLNVIGNIGAATGYPAIAMTLTNDWSQVKNKDADILIIGALPEELRDNNDMNILLNKTRDWIKSPLNKNKMSDSQLNNVNVAESKTIVSANESIAAIFGIQSPYHQKRSIVALLAENQQGFVLLNNALADKKNLDKIFGSVTVIRNTRVDSLRVGNAYSLGNLPGWQNFWLALEKHPIKLALIALLAAIIVTFLLWVRLSIITQRRLNGNP